MGAGSNGIIRNNYSKRKPKKRGKKEHRTHGTK